MAVYDNMNYSYSPGVAPGIIQYYERTLLRDPMPDMVHSRDAQKRTLPEGNGKHVNFFRFNPWGAITTPLEEGKTPDGQILTQTTFSVMPKPYGRHVEITDELDLYHINNVHRETARMLSDQAKLSLDTITRDAINAGMNVQYAGGKAARSAITSADKLTAAEIKKVVRTLKRANCKPFPDGFYHAIVHPDAVYDLTDDPLWVDVAKYQDKSRIDKYELGTMYKVKFFESTNAKTFTAESYIYGTVAQLAASTDWDRATRSFGYDAEVTADQARELTGKLVYLQFGESTTPMCVERVDTATKRVYFRWQLDDTANWTVAKSLKIVPPGTATDTVYSTLIYGQNAYGDVELGGNGKNVKIIINPPGSSGSADPLEQRGTLAWKVKGFCAAILQDSFIVRLEHGATA